MAARWCRPEPSTSTSTARPTARSRRSWQRSPWCCCATRRSCRSPRDERGAAGTGGRPVPQPRRVLRLSQPRPGQASRPRARHRDPDAAGRRHRRARTGPRPVRARLRPARRRPFGDRRGHRARARERRRRRRGRRRRGAVRSRHVRGRVRRARPAAAGRAARPGDGRARDGGADRHRGALGAPVRARRLRGRARDRAGVLPGCRRRGRRHRPAVRTRAPDGPAPRADPAPAVGVDDLPAARPRGVQPGHLYARRAPALPVRLRPDGRRDRLRGDRGPGRGRRRRHGGGRRDGAQRWTGDRRGGAAVRVVPHLTRGAADRPARRVRATPSPGGRHTDRALPPRGRASGRDRRGRPPRARAG